VCYTGMICLSRVFADPGIPFDERILIPLFLLATVAAAIAMRAWWPAASLPLRVVSIVVVLAWLVASASASYDEAAAALDTGVDFAADEWKLSPLVTWARDSAAQRPIYTNWPPVILFHVGRGSHELPSPRQTDVLRAFADTLRVRHGVAVVWNQPNPDFIGPDALRHTPGLRQVAQFDDGTIFEPLPLGSDRR